MDELDLTHLHALELRAHNERQRLASAYAPEEIALRQVWVKQAEEEVRREREFLGLPPPEPVAPIDSIEDLLNQLGV